MSSLIQQKIDHIYLIIADKTMSFGTKVKQKGSGEMVIGYGRYGFKKISDGSLQRRRLHQLGNLEYSLKVIGKPVMIGDILDWEEKRDKGPIQYDVMLHGPTREEIILSLREHKRLPLENQSDECIMFIYGIVKDERLPGDAGGGG